MMKLEEEKAAKRRAEKSMSAGAVTSSEAVSAMVGFDVKV